MAQPTGGERRVVLTSALGKEVAKEEGLPDITLFIGDGERGEVAPGRRRLAVPAGPHCSIGSYVPGH
jgi:hypothetical protein